MKIWWKCWWHCCESTPLSHLQQLLLEARQYTVIQDSGIDPCFHIINWNKVAIVKGRYDSQCIKFILMCTCQSDMSCDLDLSSIIQQLDAIFQALVMFSINVHNRSILLEVKFIIRYKIARHHLLIPADWKNSVKMCLHLIILFDC